jgi:sn-glycerol 3-phosphate transport system substrate-binding protein
MLRNAAFSVPGLLFALLSALCAASPAGAATEIRFWHAMSGARGEALESLVERFNASQREYHVVARYKGSYEQTLALALGSRKSVWGPHLFQVYEAGTAEVMGRDLVVRPLWKVMAEAGQPLATDYLSAIGAHFSDAQGRLLALPFNLSTPVLYYNRDAFRKAKLDPSHPPRTWYEMPAVLGALVESGRTCAFTTTAPSWVLLENMSTWHNEEFATEHNGLDGSDARLAFNHSLMVRWISMLSTWRKAGYFTYAGRGAEGENRFASGECAVLTASSASYAELRARAKFDLGVAQFPYYDDLNDAPQNTLIGGAGLWAIAGKSRQEYRGIASFVAFLARPQTQAEWQKRTGDMPLSAALYESLRARGFYAANPAQAIALAQLQRKRPTRDSQGLRIAQMPQIRGIVDEELELVWGGKKNPIEALNSAVDRGNALLIKAAAQERD